MTFAARLKARWTSRHFRQSVMIATVAILGGATLAALIQERFDLYSTSFTMSLVGGAALGVGMAIVWLLDRRRYGWAWAAAVILPIAVYLAFMAVLAEHPPTPPLG